MYEDNEIVSPMLAKELDERVEKANGDIQAVRHEIEDELHALEQKAEAENTYNEHRPQIALLLSEIEYLDAKAAEANQVVEEKHEGLLDRIRGWFHS